MKPHLTNQNVKKEEESNPGQQNWLLSLDVGTRLERMSWVLSSTAFSVRPWSGCFWRNCCRRSHSSAVIVSTAATRFETMATLLLTASRRVLMPVNWLKPEKTNAQLLKTRSEASKASKLGHNCQRQHGKKNITNSIFRRVKLYAFANQTVRKFY